MALGTRRLWLVSFMVLFASLASGRVAAGVLRLPESKVAWIAMVVREVKVHDGNPVVLLQTKGGERLLPIWIGEREAQAIQLRQSGVTAPRPLTHDLLEAVLRTLRARVVRVEIDDLRDNVFIGKLVLRDGANTEHRIDARPSDLITLAAGSPMPVHVAPHVLKRAGLDGTETTTPRSAPAKDRTEDPGSI